MKDELSAKIQYIKALQEKLTILLDEYIIINDSKGKLYHIKLDEVEMSGEKKYYLVKIADNKVVCYGNIKILQSYLNIRKIKIENIFSDCKNIIHTISIFLNCN